MASFAALEARAARALSPGIPAESDPQPPSPARGGVPPTASCPRGRRQGVSAAPRRPGPAPTPLARRATHHADLGADKQVRHGARVPVRFPTWALDLVPTSAPRARALRPAARIPLLRLRPLVVPIPARPALDRSGGQSGAGVRDVPRPRAIQGPAPAPHRTGRVRVVGVALAPAAWGRQARLLRLHPLNCNSSSDRFPSPSGLLRHSEESREQTATPPKPPNL